MIMDVRRSCAVELCQFFEKPTLVKRSLLPPVAGQNACLVFGPTLPPPLKIRWYFAAPTARPFPVPHLWASTLYLDMEQKAATDTGIDPFAPAPWSNGATPPGAAGVHFCGQVEDFTAPIKYVPRLLPRPKNRQVLPSCCVPPCLVFNALPPVPPALVLLGAGPASGDALLAWSSGNNVFCPAEYLPSIFRLKFSAPGFTIDGQIFDVPQILLPYPALWILTNANGTVVVEQFSASLPMQLGFNVFIGLANFDNNVTSDHDALVTCAPLAVKWHTLMNLNGVPTGTYCDVELLGFY